MSTKFLHVDGDSFFVACEQAQYPHLKGKPVVVGEERGIACAMSYEAKALGVTRGLPIYTIRRELPGVIILPSHFELYEMYSEKMVAVLKKFLGTVEKYSIDECFALITDKDAKRYGGYKELGLLIKNQMQSELGITFSLGIADTKVLAKVASKYQKPDGFTYIEHENIREYLKKVSIENIWGIGYRTAPKLEALGVHTAYDFINLNREYIDQYFDLPLQEIWQELNGNSVLGIGGEFQPQKSLQATQTFPKASKDRSYVFSELSKNIEIACERMRDINLSTNHICVFIKTKNFRYYTRDIKLPFFTQNPSDILRYVHSEFPKIFKHGEEYRTTGITLLNLTSENHIPTDLFGVQKNIFERKALLDKIDMLKSRYGTNVIFLASSMQAQNRKKEEFVKKTKKDRYIYGLPYPYLGEVL